jgi:putative membrane protein
MMSIGYNGFWSWLTMGLGVVMHVAFAAMVILSAIWLYKKVISGPEVTTKPTSAVDILQRRLAKGEINVEEYQVMRQELE